MSYISIEITDSILKAN